jgi:hypothetical protein
MSVLLFFAKAERGKFNCSESETDSGFLDLQALLP